MINELTQPDKELLLNIAKNSIKACFSDNADEKINLVLNEKLKIKTGVFVTLRINQNLRGCIGYIYSKNILTETVFDAARQAAFNDPRFLPLTPEELKNLTIEISVLTTPREINSYDEIILGKHGLLFDTENHKALLLPQVPLEYNMDLPQFLSALCEKAGLYQKFWELKQLKLKVFEAVIFSGKIEGE